MWNAIWLNSDRVAVAYAFPPEYDTARTVIKGPKTIVDKYEKSTLMDI